MLPIGSITEKSRIAAKKVVMGMIVACRATLKPTITTTMGTRMATAMPMASRPINSTEPWQRASASILSS